MKTFEFGHDKNIALIDELIEKTIGFGVSYNPGSNDLKVAGLQTLKTSLHTAQTNVDNTRGLMTDATNDRQFIFDEMRKRATRLVGEAIACGADEKLVADMRSVMRKLMGKRSGKIEEVVTPAPPAEGEEAEAKAPESDPAPKVRRSVSQTSFDMRVEHMRRLKVLVEQVTGYTSNEADLTIVAVGTLCTNAENATKNVNVTKANHENARFTRDKLMYRKPTGALYIAERVKNYVKALYGAKSAQYESVMRIHLKKFKYAGL
ncbi:MAG: hypothetical protein V2A54_08150 [Bacteroidota bacterium]